MHAGRRRRRLRRPRGPVDADPRLPAGPAHRQAGQDVLQPRRVLLRPRAPAPGEAVLRVRGRARRHAGHAQAQRPARRRRVRLLVRGRRRQRRLARARARTGSRDVEIDAFGVYTNNPPCGAMRGFGASRRASPTRRRWTSWPTRRAWTRSRSGSSTPWARATSTSPARSSTPRRRSPSCCARVRAAAAARARARSRTSARCPASVGNTTHGEGVVRGVGYAVTFKNVGFSEGFDDYSTARVRLEVIGGEPVGDGAHRGRRGRPGPDHRPAQIARTELGVAQVVVHPKNTAVGSGGSTSASRQTYVTGGAVKNACEAVAGRRPGAGARLSLGRPAAELRLDGGKIVADCGEVLTGLADVLGRRRRRGDDGVPAPADRTPSTRRPARATPTSSTPSPRTGRSSTSTSSSAWSRSSSWTPRRTSARRSTRRRRRPDPGRHRRRAWASR